MHTPYCRNVGLTIRPLEALPKGLKLLKEKDVQDSITVRNGLYPITVAVAQNSARARNTIRRTLRRRAGKRKAVRRNPVCR